MYMKVHYIIMNVMMERDSARVERGKDSFKCKDHRNADAFDAMTANRVYRKKLDMEFVLNEIKKGRGTQFDPMLVDIMLDLIEDGTIDVQKIYAP